MGELNQMACPCASSPPLSLSRQSSLSPKFRKQRSLSRETHTVGQLIQKAVCSFSLGVYEKIHTLSIHTSFDVPQNLQYTSDYESNVIEQSSNVEWVDYVCGIQLIPNSPQLDNAPLVYFTDTEIASQHHATKVETLFSDVMNKFVPKCKGIFSADFIQKWAVWKECKLQRWNTIFESACSE